MRNDIHREDRNVNVSALSLCVNFLTEHTVFKHMFDFEANYVGNSP